jgi:phosphate-selective porin OprO and OprP
MDTRSRGYRWRAATVLAALLALPALSGDAWARREPSREELLDRIERLEAIIQKQGLDKAKPAAAEGEEGAPVDKPQVEAIIDEKLRKQKVLAGWKDGFYLESPSGDFKLKLRGYAQADYRFFPLETGDTGTDSFYMRRVRPIFEGTVYKYFDFRIMPDFGDGNFVLQDAYMDVNYFKPWAALRAGQFKVPFSLERLQGGSELLFIERSISNQLGPNRDVGAQLSGTLFDESLLWQVGAFNGSVDGGNSFGDTTSDKDGAARIWAQPFRTTDWNWAKNLGIGFATTFGDVKNDAGTTTNYRLRTPGRSTWFRMATSSDVTINGDGERTRIAPQGYYFWGPFGLMGEYIRSTQRLRRDDADTGSMSRGTFTNWGWTTQASYVLTGEDASYKMVTPINPFDPWNGRWGAFEIAARGGITEVDEALFEKGFAKEGQSAQKAANYGLGVNWYLNKNFKFQANWERTEFNDEVAFGDHDRDHEDVLLMRFQVSY